jgi:hypothetical protein
VLCLRHRLDRRGGVGALFSCLVDRISIAATDGHDDYDHLFVANLIDETIADAAQLNLMAVCRAGQLRGRNMRSIKTLGELLLKLVPGLCIELAPFFQRGVQKAKFIGHQLRS